MISLFFPSKIQWYDPILTHNPTIIQDFISVNNLHSNELQSAACNYFWTSLPHCIALYTKVFLRCPSIKAHQGCLGHTMNYCNEGLVRLQSTVYHKHNSSGCMVILKDKTKNWYILNWINLHLHTFHRLQWHLLDFSQAQLLFVEQFVTCLLVLCFHLTWNEEKRLWLNQQ